ncbi:hypothetical protein TorRG33x02_309590 [Trema orientale]|uniref:Uncharacterized protein n=1 Tax=Trema orientale TaxID=63057 RepID=A0A2P5BTD6_TREOI|nr:hypothetical protein TorRG33x02_309590 [Trema orientale]
MSCEESRSADELPGLRWVPLVDRGVSLQAGLPTAVGLYMYNLIWAIGF